MNNRQVALHSFDESGQNLVVGSIEHCPLSPTCLSLIDDTSSYVTKVIKSGLTAEVYRLNIEGVEYTLKKKREHSRVANLDGKYSFLNEVQRRRDFENLKRSGVELPHIVDTVYANYRLGIILSPWIEGQHITRLSQRTLTQLFTTLEQVERHGLMEWDLCSGNLLVDDQGNLALFDFGYMYEFDPLTEFNSNGVSDPIFDMAERFETRFFSGWVLKQKMSTEQQLNAFRTLKTVLLNSYRNKLAWLQKNRANREIIERALSKIELWQHALSSETELAKVYEFEMFRSHVLDIEDDLHGRSCTPLTLQRIMTVLDNLRRDYDSLKQHNLLIYGNRDKSKDELLTAYQEKYDLAQLYQLD